ncbi:hypothetical protein Tco_0540308 [Tanacetum coccineum]
MHGPYVRRMIPEPGDPDREVPVAKKFHEQTNDELTDKEEIWLCVQQMMKGSDIGVQEKKAKFFNEWERFTSNDGESIESYYHRFSKLMNDFKRNKHFLEKIASNLKFLNNLQPEWRRHAEVNELRVERLARTHDPLALMANSNNPYNYLVFHQDYPSQITYMQQPLPNNNYILQPSFNQNYMQQPVLNPEDISDTTTAMNMALVLMAKMVGGNGGNQFRQYAGQNVRNQNGYNVVQNVENQNANQNGNGNVIAARAEGNGNGNNKNQLIAQKEEARIQLQAKEFDLMVATGDLDEIKEVNANCILMANLQQAST